MLATSDSLDEKGRLTDGNVLARIDGELARVPAKDVEFVDISPKQIVGVSASLIPFLEHDDANRALMGSNMQRQAVPLIKVDPPCVATGMERVVGEYSGMVVTARNAGKVTDADSERILAVWLEGFVGGQATRKRALSGWRPARCESLGVLTPNGGPS